MNDFNDFLTKCDQHRQAVTKANELNKVALFDALSAAGITTITVKFDGEGDSGQIEDVIAYAADQIVRLPAASIVLHKPSWNQPGLTSIDTTLSAAVETLCYGYLEQEHDGWENNDGAHGSFEFIVSERTISLSFSERFTDVHETSHSF